MIIYRSSNAPIMINFDNNIESIPELSVGLYWDNNYSTLIQTWDQDSVYIQENKLIIPFTQSQTASYPVGIGHLEVKWLDNNGVVFFSKSYSLEIKSYKNLKILGEDEEIDYSNIIIETIDIPSSITNDIRIIKEEYDFESIPNETIDTWFNDNEFNYEVQPISNEEIDSWFEDIDEKDMCDCEALTEAEVLELLQ